MCYRLPISLDTALVMLTILALLITILIPPITILVKCQNTGDREDAKIKQGTGTYQKTALCAIKRIQKHKVR